MHERLTQINMSTYSAMQKCMRISSEAQQPTPKFLQCQKNPCSFHIIDPKKSSIFPAYSVILMFTHSITRKMKLISLITASYISVMSCLLL